MKSQLNYTGPVRGVPFKCKYNIILSEFTVYIDIIDFTRCLIFWVKDIYQKGCIVWFEIESIILAYKFFLWVNIFPRRTRWYRFCLLSRNTDRIISLSITSNAVRFMWGWEEQILPDTNFNFNSDLSSSQNSCVKTFPIISPAIFYRRRILRL